MNRIAPLIAATIFLASCAGSPPPVPAPRPAAALPEPMPAPRSSYALTPVPAGSVRSIDAPRIRVGLVGDQGSYTFPRTTDGYYLVGAAGPAMLRRGFTVVAPLRDAAVHYAVQVAAISDKSSADAFMERLRTEGTRVDSVFDPSASNGGMYRVLAGDFADSKSAQPLRDQLTQRGYGKDMLVVRRPSDQPFQKHHQITDDEGEQFTIEGDSLLVMPVTAETIVIDGKPYRTAARVTINARGLLNIINELSLEDYLRGVVPAEMGSKIYDELEALKAQALAARTYAVRNLGQFGAEGYDICPGPACQAYKGFSGEEALTDQAVGETAGQVIAYQGRLIDSLYTAACGGATSDVGTMFPGRNEPYLRRASCVELEMTSIGGRSDSALLTEQQANGRVFAAMAGLPDGSASWSAADVAAAVRAAQRLIGGAQPGGAPASSRRGDVLAWLASTLKLDSAAATLTLPEDRKYFFPSGADPDAPAFKAAAFLIKYGIWPAQALDKIDLSASIPRDELYALLGAWVREHELLKDVTGKIAFISARNVILKVDGRSTAYTMPDGIPIFRRLGDRLQEYRDVPVMIGDRATLVQDPARHNVALIVLANYDGAAFDRTSSFSNWTRSYRADELVKSMNNRNPIQQLLDIRPVTIDASKRIAELEVTAEGGRKFMLRGLPVRWSLNVPDNLFVYEKTKDPDGMDRYTFYGKGWGHGVGMCQVGAYGMAFRGYKAEQIIKRYYTGVDIVPMSAAAR